MKSREAELADHDFIDDLDRIVSRNNLLYPYPEPRFGFYFSQHVLYQKQNHDKEDLRRTEITTNIAMKDGTPQQWNARFRMIGSEKTGAVGFYALRNWRSFEESEKEDAFEQSGRELWFAAVSLNWRLSGVFKNIIIDALTQAIINDKASKLFVRPKSSPSWLIDFLTREKFQKLENDAEGRSVLYFDSSNMKQMTGK